MNSKEEEIRYSFKKVKLCPYLYLQPFPPAALNQMISGMVGQLLMPSQTGNNLKV